MYATNKVPVLPPSLAAKWKDELKNANAKKFTIAPKSNTITKKKSSKPFMKKIVQQVRINGRLHEKTKMLAIYNDKESYTTRMIRKINGNKKKSTPSFAIGK